MDTHELAVRIERLERENRWMRRAGLAVVVVALAAVLIGATVPEEIPKEITARVFRVVDEDGESAIMSPPPASSTLVRRASPVA